MDRDESIRRNRQSLPSWERFASHRDQITRLIESLRRCVPVRRASSRRWPGRLIVLGAGNANDLDLARMAELFDEVVLLDWDVESVSAGVERQRSRASSDAHWNKVTVGPTLDLSERSAELQALGKFDVVASLGLLSQIIELRLSQFRRDDVDDVVEIAEALHLTRRKHFGVISDLMASGGAALFTTEFVSSDTLPQLRTSPESEWGVLLRDALLTGNFFSGTQPASVLDSARMVFGRRDLNVQPTAPWRWDFGPRLYAVVGYLVTS